MKSKGEVEMSILDIINLSKTYGKGENKLEALKNINISIEKGKFTAIIGPSGSGKSTLLNCIAGLDNISSGKVLLEGKDISTETAKSVLDFAERHQCFKYDKDNLSKKLYASLIEMMGNVRQHA